jgi:hypothetical protein
MNSVPLAAGQSRNATATINLPLGSTAVTLEIGATLTETNGSGTVMVRNGCVRQPPPVIQQPNNRNEANKYARRSGPPNTVSEHRPPTWRTGRPCSSLASARACSTALQVRWVTVSHRQAKLAAREAEKSAPRSSSGSGALPSRPASSSRHAVRVP